MESNFNMDLTFVKNCWFQHHNSLLQVIPIYLTFINLFKLLLRPFLASIFSLDTDIVQQKLCLPGKYI